MKYTTSPILILFFVFQALAKPQPSTSTCAKWFQNTHISTTDKSCILKCSSSMVDMDTFDCPNQCDIFCGKNKKCTLKDVWRRKVKPTYPPQWVVPQEKLSSLSEDELQIVVNALSKLPDSFGVETLEGIYKLEKSKDIFARGTSSSYSDGKIVLYQNAFLDPNKVISIIIHELGHHLHETSLKKTFQDYQKALRWRNPDIPRPGPYFDSDSKNSPDEDFATNFEVYVINPGALKSQVPLAFSWMQKNLKNKFSLKECTP